MKNRGLGKGLSALMGDDHVDLLEREVSETNQVIDINLLAPGNFQPRKYFEPQSLKELSNSIANKGVISPIIVQTINEDGIYKIIAGERRWRASKMAGLEQMPVIIVNLSNTEALEFALIENIQRAELTPIEEAESFQRLMEEFSYTQENVAQAIGKSRSYVANMLRLLVLPGAIKNLVNDGQLSIGHARTLINVKDSEHLAHQIIRQGLNVRQTERLIGNIHNPEVHAPAPKQDDDTGTNEELKVVEQILAGHLSMKVTISSHGGVGKLTIFFDNLGQLDSLLQQLNS
jgi:ParB family chromosome partitioning protein